MVIRLPGMRLLNSSKGKKSEKELECLKYSLACTPGSGKYSASFFGRTKVRPVARAKTATVSNAIRTLLNPPLSDSKVTYCCCCCEPAAVLGAQGLRHASSLSAERQ